MMGGGPPRLTPKTYRPEGRCGGQAGCPDKVTCATGHSRRAALVSGTPGMAGPSSANGRHDRPWFPRLVQCSLPAASATRCAGRWPPYRRSLTCRVTPWCQQIRVHPPFPSTQHHRCQQICGRPPDKPGTAQVPLLPPPHLYHFGSSLWLDIFCHNDKCGRGFNV